MAMGKKLITQGFYACTASALLIICISVPAVFFLVRSGKSVCVPGLSIRCDESDCGRFFQRCGSNVLLEVPADKVCYKGALVSASRTDLHLCPSTVSIARNSSRSQDKLGNCHCNTQCTSYQICDCLCQCSSCTGTSPSNTAAVRKVKCKSPVTKYYPSAEVASCCLGTGYSTKNCQTAAMWEIALQSVQQQFTNLFMGQSFLQDAAASFTFRAPLRNSCCNVSGACSSVCG